MKKLISFLLTAVIVFSSLSFAFAGTGREAEGELYVTPLGANSCIIADDNSRVLLSSRETPTSLIFTIEDLADVDESDCLIVNKKEGTLYSTITGKTVDLAALKQKTAGVLAVGDVVDTFTVKFSYAILAESLVPDSNQAKWGAVIIALTSAASGVPIGSTAGVVIALLGVLDWDELKAGIVSKSSKHGIEITVNQVEIQKHQGGRIVKGYKYEIMDIDAY